MKDLTKAEELLMLTIWRLKDDAYGVTIRKNVAKVTERTLIYGTLYNLLDQLLKKGFVSKKRGEPTTERGGRSKIYYTLTNSGRKSLQNSRELNHNMWSDIPDLAFKE